MSSSRLRRPPRVFDAPNDRHQRTKTPPRQARIHRHRFRMTAKPEPRRLPSVCPRPCGQGGPRRARSYTRTTQCPHPCCLPRSDPATSMAMVVASNYPARNGLPCGAPPGCGEDASLRCLQPTYDTSTLRIDRFLRVPSFGLAASLRRHSGGASLDGDSPASARHRPPSPRPRCEAGASNDRSRETRHRSVLAGAAIGSPSGGAPLPRCFQPAVELAT